MWHDFIWVWNGFAPANGIGGGGQDGYHNMMKGMDKMFEERDVNSNGAVTQDGVDSTRKQKLSKFNADKDGAFSLDEYAVYG